MHVRDRDNQRTRRGRRGALLVVCAVTLAACSVGRNYMRPSLQVPDQWRAECQDTVSLGHLPWWALFDDPTLQALLQTALAANGDVQLAAARVQASRATLRVTRAQLFPQVNANGSFDTTRTSERSLTAVSPGTDVTKDVYATSFDLAFELDFWGRVRRATEAARADLLATEAARQTVISGVISGVAQGYYSLLELDRELEIARLTLASRTQSLRLVRLRESEGLASELDRRQAEAELAVVGALVPQLERSVTQTENGLRALLGQNPGPIARGAPLDAHYRLPAIPAGLPSDLLERRPDIRQAEQGLVAANARIGEAKAAYFPRVTLTGLFGIESVALSDLFTSPARVWQFGPGVSLPLFTAGRTRATVQAAEARHAEALATYQQTVRQAFREVEDALVFHRKAGEQATELTRQVAAASRALELARVRYLHGASSHLDVLDAQRQLLAAELDQVRVRRDQLLALVQVYRALGGGWLPGDPVSEPL